jgi:hypothetical protein
MKMELILLEENSLFTDEKRYRMRGFLKFTAAENH